MSTESIQQSAGYGTCPHCGQPLLTERAARQLRASEVEAGQKTDAPEPESGPEPLLHETETESAAELHDVRLSVRQF